MGCADSPRVYPIDLLVLMSVSAKLAMCFVAVDGGMVLGNVKRVIVVGGSLGWGRDLVAHRGVLECGRRWG